MKSLLPVTNRRNRVINSPTAISNSGRFNPSPFQRCRKFTTHSGVETKWVAGGGIAPRTIYGTTDEFGYFAVEDICTIYDLQATILHLLGLDYQRMTYRQAGRDFRLTDIHGIVVHDILA